MSMYCNWIFHGKNNDGSMLTEEQIDRLTALDGHDFEDLTFDPGEEMFAFGETVSICSIERIEESLKSFSAANPETELTVYYHAETDEAPCGFHAKYGKVRPFSSRITYYYDDNGELLDDE